MFFFKSISLCFTFVCKFRLINFVKILKGNLSKKEYKKITSVLSSESSLNVQEPKNDLNTKGPFVILIAVTFGLLKVTYSVTIPSPFFATQYAFTPLSAVIAPSIKSALFKKVSHFNRLL